MEIDRINKILDQIESNEEKIIMCFETYEEYKEYISINYDCETEWSISKKDIAKLKLLGTVYKLVLFEPNEEYFEFFKSHQDAYKKIRKITNYVV